MTRVSPFVRDKNAQLGHDFGTVVAFKRPSDFVDVFIMPEQRLKESERLLTAVTLKHGVRSLVPCQRLRVSQHLPAHAAVEFIVGQLVPIQ